MAQLKTRFTVWMEPDTLQAAKARAVQEGVTVSEVLAAAAKRCADRHRPAKHRCEIARGGGAGFQPDSADRPSPRV